MRNLFGAVESAIGLFIFLPWGQTAYFMFEAKYLCMYLRKRKLQFLKTTRNLNQGRIGSEPAP